MVVAAGLGVLVATDAHRAAGVAWLATGLAIGVLALGAVTGSAATVQVSVALLGALLLFRADDRLLLAPLYGGGLLLIFELARSSIELAGIDRVTGGSTAARLGVILATASGGTCAAGLAAVAVLVAPARSLAVTAAGAAAVLAATGTVVWVARRPRHRNPTTRP